MKKKFGMVFPGQGAQYVGMLSDVSQEYKEVQQVYAEASSVLGYDLWSLVVNGPEEVLNQTEYTQPALLAGCYAIWKIVSAYHTPCVLAGHSLGEYTALVCAGSLRFTDAIRLVAARGMYMQEAVPPGVGGLAAIVGLSDAQVAQLCSEVKLKDNEYLAPANFNSQGQVVIAGNSAPLLQAIDLAKSYGAKLAKLLPVSVPSHCLLMKGAADKLGALLADMPIKSPNIKIINNVDVMPYSNEESIRCGLTKQLYSPVRWVEIIHDFISNGITHIIECGPGKVLTGLNRRISAELTLFHTDKLSNLRHVLETCEIE